MFVEYSTRIDASLPVVEARFDRIRSGIDGQTSVAYRKGTDLFARVGPTGAVVREVRLAIGPPEVLKKGLVYPIHWSATGADSLFPELTADLVLSQDGRERTRLSLKGTYQPPLGPIGRLADRAFLGRVAEATVSHWMDRLAETINFDLAPS